VVTEVQDRDAAKRAQVTGGGLSAVANLAGIDPLQELTSDARIQEVLKSRELAEEFIRRNGLVAELFPKAKRPVTLWFAAKRFRERVLYVFEDRLKGTTTVSIEWTDPVVAAKWANSIVALANELIRSDDLRTSQRKIAYLEREADLTSAVGVRRYLYDSLAQETETVMWANGRTEYAFSIVDPARPPELRTRPSRTLITVLGTTAGLVTAVVVVFAGAAQSKRMPGAGAGNSLPGRHSC
jgi:uncharacterized protein involved in exopolysaccharide biosynthesis